MDLLGDGGSLELKRFNIYKKHLHYFRMVRDETFLYIKSSQKIVILDD